MLEIDSNPNELGEKYFGQKVQNGAITLYDAPGLGIAVPPDLMTG